MRVKLSSRLFEVDIDTESLEQLIDMSEEEVLPIDKGWTLLIGLFPHPDMKAEVVYKLRFAPKKEELMLEEHWMNDKFEHPIELDGSQCNCWELGFIPVNYILEFILGLDSSLGYAT
jgi:hypothetical protein